MRVPHLGGAVCVSCGQRAGACKLPQLWNVFLVAVNLLPGGRDTLILRLLGRGKVLQQALDEAHALPSNTPERRIARLHFAAREEVKRAMKQRGLTAEEQEYLQATEDLVERYQREAQEEGRKKGREEGRKEVREEEAQGLRKGLKNTYRARFGHCPRGVGKALDAAADVHQLTEWIPVFATGSEDEIARALARRKR